MSALSPLSPFKNIGDLSMEPGDLKEKIVSESGAGIGTRLLSVLQLITSALAIPILLAVGVLEAAFYAITCQMTKAKQVCQGLGMIIPIHILFAIPEAITSILLPHSWSQAIMKPWEEVVAEIVTITSCQCEKTKQL